MWEVCDHFLLLVREEQSKSVFFWAKFTVRLQPPNLIGLGTHDGVGDLHFSTKPTGVDCLPLLQGRMIQTDQGSGHCRLWVANTFSDATGPHGRKCWAFLAAGFTRPSFSDGGGTRLHATWPKLLAVMRCCLHPLKSGNPMQKVNIVLLDNSGQFRKYGGQWTWFEMIENGTWIAPAFVPPKHFKTFKGYFWETCPGRCLRLEICGTVVCAAISSATWAGEWNTFQNWLPPKRQKEALNPKYGETKSACSLS